MEQLFSISDIYSKKREKILIQEELLVGQIIKNRIVGISYENTHDLFTAHEIRKALKNLYYECQRKAAIQKNNVLYLSEIFESASFKYAFLKGAVLVTKYYKLGCRNSNDIDVLVNSEDISKIQMLLSANGFVQGYIDKNNNVLPASRREIVMSRMNYGETIPFVKIQDGEPLEVDINFSVDFKPDKISGGIVDNLLNRRVYIQIENACISTLEKEDFLIHLCCHLFKEATTYDWVRRKSDLLLYKFSDINVFLHEEGSYDFLMRLAERIKELGVEKECYYTLANSGIIYPALCEMEGIRLLLQRIKPSTLQFMTQIVSPLEGKVYQYNMSFREWFFCEDRVSNLKEVNNESFRKK